MDKFRKSFTRMMIGAPVLALLLALAGCASAPETTSNSAASGANTKPSKGVLARVFESSKPVTLPDGTVIPVTLDQTISSADSRSGDEFIATVSEPVVAEGKTVIPQGAHVKGRVVDAKSSGRLNSPGRLELALTSVEVGGIQYDIQTSDTRSVGKGHMQHNLIFIGGGSAVGALIGGIVGGGKGAAIGAGAGAGGGTAAAAATGKMEVRLPAETRLRFPLVQPVTIKVKG
jgi:hypothetical protein